MSHNQIKDRTLTEEETKRLAECLFVVNKTAKETSGEKKKELYRLKNEVLSRMLIQNIATIKGLQYSIQKTINKERSDVLIEIAGSSFYYGFHQVAQKHHYHDNELPHLGKRIENYRNERVYIRLGDAVRELTRYLGVDSDEFRIPLSKMSSVSNRHKGNTSFYMMRCS